MPRFRKAVVLQKKAGFPPRAPMIRSWADEIPPRDYGTRCVLSSRLGTLPKCILLRIKPTTWIRVASQM